MSIQQPAYELSRPARRLLLGLPLYLLLFFGIASALSEPFARLLDFARYTPTLSR